MPKTPPVPDDWNPSLPLFIAVRIETVEGETARYAPTPAGELRLFGHFPRTWPFHYGCVPGVVSLGDESVAAGPEGEDNDWLDAIVCGGDAEPGDRVDCRVVGIALRTDGDHKLLTVAMEAPELAHTTSPDDLPPDVCGTVVDWFEHMGVHHEIAGVESAWEVIERSATGGPVPINRYRSAGGLVTHDGELLLLERPKQDEVRLPKGHVEPGESLEETALRETKEESGLRGLDLERPLGTVRNLFHHDNRLWIRDETYFLYKWRGKNEKKGEKQFQRRWVSWDEALTRLTFSAERQVVRAAMAG